jgi:magnesium-transporting ATPase (P-type)
VIAGTPRSVRVKSEIKKSKTFKRKMSRFAGRVEGLSNEQVIESRLVHGENTLPLKEVESFWEKFVENFNDPLIKILCAALAITLLLSVLGYSNWIDGS